MIIDFINKNKIPDDYMFVFHGEEADITYETYVYKIEDKPANMGFKVINTIVNKNIRKITRVGEVTWTDDVFAVAYYNNAYSYVTTRDGSKYTIDEFIPMFLMD